MAQRSARARSKLDKITAANGSAAPHPSQRKPALGHGAARLGSGGLLTPSASSVSGSSTRNSQPPPRIGKGALRSFFDAQGEKLRGRLAHGNQRRDTDGATSFYAGLGGGVGLGHANRGGHGGLSGLGTIGEERVQVRRWEGTGSRGENWDGGGQGKKVGSVVVLAWRLRCVLTPADRIWTCGFPMATRWSISPTSRCRRGIRSTCTSRPCRSPPSGCAPAC